MSAGNLRGRQLRERYMLVQVDISSPLLVQVCVHREKSSCTSRHAGMSCRRDRSGDGFVHVGMTCLHDVMHVPLVLPALPWVGTAEPMARAHMHTSHVHTSTYTCTWEP